MKRTESHSFAYEIMWNANLMQQGNFVDSTAPSAPYTRPTQRLSRPPLIQKLGVENHMLQPNI